MKTYKCRDTDETDERFVDVEAQDVRGAAETFVEDLYWKGDSNRLEFMEVIVVDGDARWIVEVDVEHEVHFSSCKPLRLGEGKRARP